MTRISDPYEELASLFLTEADDGAPAESLGDGDAPIASEGRSPSLAAAESMPTTLRGPLEIAIVGHLPVMGGLWLTQYADQVARLEGPTALVRLERGQATVELLRAPGPRSGLEGVETLQEAIHVLGTRARHWIVCPTGESAIDGPLAGDALTLLTGSDDAAIVGAYRIVKSLAERWHAARWPMPPIGLVVLGATAERVNEVAEKLDRTTKAFLDVEMSVVAQHQRMDAIESAGRRTFAGSTPSLGEVCRMVQSLLRRQRESAAASPPPSVLRGPANGSVGSRVGPGAAPRAAVTPSPLVWPFTAAASRKDEPKPAPPPLRREPLPPLRPAAETPPFRVPVGPSSAAGRGLPKRLVESKPSLVADAPSVPAPAPPSEPVPAPVASPRPVVDLPPSVGIDGLETLPFRCPAFPAVELAVDADGTLHVIADLARVAELPAVQAWARAHRSLLAMACQRLDAAAVDRVVAHVTTTDAPSVALLHGAGWRLHAIVTASNGERLVVALNR